MNAVEANREVEQRAGVEEMIPGDAGVKRLRVGVGVLSGDQLKGHHLLIGECVLREDSIVRAEVLIDADAGRIGIDRLWRIGIERPRVDVSAVRDGLRVGVDPALEQAKDRWVGGERNAFDPAGRTADTYKVKVMPSSFVIGKDGSLLLRHARSEEHTSELQSHSFISY